MTSTNQPTGGKPTPASTPATPPPPKPKSKGTEKVVAISVVIGVLLLGVIGVLTYQNLSKSRQLEEKVSQLEEAERLRMELEDQYDRALMELEELRDTNAELNSLIEEQIQELEAQRRKIARLIKDRRRLEEARAELAQLREQVAGYIEEIQALKEENAMLAARADSLSVTADSLARQLEGTLAEKEQLARAQAMLVTEKEQLADKVHLASVIKVADVEVTGYKYRKGKSPSRRRTAKAVDLLRICFTALPNEVAKPGTEKFFIRIINPVGETLAIEELGSGTIINPKTKEEILYTQVAEHEYANEEERMCFDWKPDINFQKGNYTVEIYNKGYLAGQGSFVLK